MKSLFLDSFKKFKALILVLFLFSSLFSQISLDINLLNTAQYTLTNFNDPNLDLWTVNVINNYPFPRVINLEVTLNYNEIQPAIWAVTYPISLGRVGENNTILLRNSDFIGAHGQVGSGNHYESQEFINMVEEMSKTVQFIFITHNKVSMERSDYLMGVTMQEAGVSRMVSVDVNQALELAES